MAFEMGGIFRQAPAKESQGQPEAAAQEAGKQEDGFQWCVRRLQRHFTVEDVKSITAVRNNDITREAFEGRARSFLAGAASAYRHDVQESALKEFLSNVFGYGRLDPLIRDRHVSDIKVLRSGEGGVRYVRDGVRLTSDIYFKDRQDLRSFFEMTATKNSKGTSFQQASSAFTDKDSDDGFRLRITLTSPFISSTDEPVITIRKFPKFKRVKEDFTGCGMMTERQYDFLAEQVANGVSLNIIGRGGTWKSSLINTLMEEIPGQDAIEIIQENEELFAVGHPETINLHVVAPQGDGRISYSLRDESTMGLLQDIDTFVIGEIKGPEALDYITANNSGTRTITSLHANSARLGMEKLVLLAKQATTLGREDLLRMMEGMGLVVFLKKENGKRRLQDILQVTGYDQDGKCLIFEDVNPEHTRKEG